MEKVAGSAQQTVCLGERNGVGMIDERITCERKTSKGRGLITQLKRTLELKGKRNEFTTKEHTDKNIILINTKLDHNEIVLSS